MEKKLFGKKIKLNHLSKKQRIDKKFNALNSNKALERDFLYAPNIAVDPYNIKEVIKNNQASYYAFEKNFFQPDVKPFAKRSIQCTSVFKVKSGWRKAVALSLTIATLGVSSYASYLVVTYVGPLIEQAYIDHLTNNLPDAKSPDSFNYENEKPKDLIDNKDLNNTEKPKDEQILPAIEINEVGQISYSNLKTNIKNTFNLFVGEENKEIVPMFMFATKSEDDLNQINLVCKMGDKSVYLQYDVYNETYFDMVFNFSSTTSSDAINTINFLLDDANITDMPQINDAYVVENSIFSHASNCEEITIGEIIGGTVDENGNTVGGEYVETKYYSFDIFTLKENGEIVDENIKIRLENAESLKSQGFDENNLNSLIEIYGKNKNAFETKTNVVDKKYNLPTAIFQNAIKLQSKETESQNNISSKKFVEEELEK